MPTPYQRSSPFEILQDRHYFFFFFFISSFFFLFSLFSLLSHACQHKVIKRIYIADHVIFIYYPPESLSLFLCQSIAAWEDSLVHLAISEQGKAEMARS